MPTFSNNKCFNPNLVNFNLMKFKYLVPIQTKALSLYFEKTLAVKEMYK